MPSDARKKRDLKKKEAAKSRTNMKSSKNVGQNSTDASAENEPEEPSTSAPIIENGDSKTGQQNGEVIDGRALRSLNIDYNEERTAVEAQLDTAETENAKARSCAGVLASHPRSRDLKIDNLTLTFYGSEILADTQLEFNHGRRYGLIGFNGCGKSTLLQSLANREFPIPDHFDIFLLSREIRASDKTAIECVIEVDKERLLLETQAEDLAHFDDDASQEKLMDIYERLDEMNAELAAVKAAELLHGLGFTHAMMQKKCRDFSGGWRMRIALARALFLKPSLLLLDEPTNHLDLDACVWLEEELKTYSRILVVVSHSQDFMNGVCTNIIHFDKQRLKYYGGNYDTFMKTRMELTENAAKRYQWEQDQIAHMKNYIARFGHGSAKLARQAQSKEKVLGKMIAAGLTEKMVQDKAKEFYFFDPGVIPPPVIMVQTVSFRYSDDKPLIYKNLDFGIDLDTRVALVGPNGAGKSTLLKLICAELMPSDGLIRRHSHVKIGRYHQHLHEMLDLNLSALDYMMKTYPDVKDIEDMRKIIGRYGITGRQQVCPMKQLSDGQRCRVSFAWLARQVPHLLLLDEPTNHLDMESIDALADAINAFEGGMILVSHDFRLVSQVTEEIWVCEHQTVTKWPGDIFSYKEHLRKRIEKDRKNRKKLTSLATGH